MRIEYKEIKHTNILRVYLHSDGVVAKPGGIEPVRWFPLRRKSEKLWIFPKADGIVPLRLSLDNSNVAKFVRLVIDAGIEPPRTLFERSSFFKVVKAPISEGIVPVSLFDANKTDSLQVKQWQNKCKKWVEKRNYISKTIKHIRSLVKAVISVGIVPLNMFWSPQSCWSCVIKPIEVGMVPVNEFVLPRSLLRVLESWNNSGKKNGPVNLLLSRSNNVKLVKVPNSVGTVPPIMLL